MAILSGLLSCRKQRHSNSVILLWYTIGDGNILRKGILSQIRPVKLTCLLIFISKAMLVFFPTWSPGLVTLTPTSISQHAAICHLCFGIVL